MVRGVAYDLPDRDSRRGASNGAPSPWHSTARDGWDLVTRPSSSALCLLQLAPGAWRRSGIARRMRCFLVAAVHPDLGRRCRRQGELPTSTDRRVGARRPAPPRGRNVPHNIQLPPDRWVSSLPDERDTCSCRPRDWAVTRSPRQPDDSSVIPDGSYWGCTQQTLTKPTWRRCWSGSGVRAGRWPQVELVAPVSCPGSHLVVRRRSARPAPPRGRCGRGVRGTGEG